MSKGFVSTAGEGTIITIRVSPGAKRTAIEGPHGESALKLKVAAPPTRSKTNAETERFLATMLGTNRSDVAVIRGSKGRNKRLLVRGLDASGTEKALLAHLP